MKLREIKSIIKGVFIPLKVRHYFGKINYGTPYFNPIGFCPTVIYIRKLKLNKDTPLEEQSKFRKDKKFSNMPMVRRSKNWTIRLFGNYYYIEVGIPIKIATVDLGWKDKWHTPRYEWSPAFIIFFFKWQFCKFWTAPDHTKSDLYWEMILWYSQYCDGDIKNAKETWGWTSNGISTWNDAYLINRERYTC